MKRSSQIALVLMGATSLGATGYAMAPRTDCVRRGPALAKVQTWPSSPPSGWQLAQATPARVAVWKIA